MNLSKDDLLIIKDIAQQLRVPELSYRAGDADEIKEEIHSFFINMVIIQQSCFRSMDHIFLLCTPF